MVIIETKIINIIQKILNNIKKEKKDYYRVRFP